MAPRDDGSPDEVNRLHSHLAEVQRDLNWVITSRSWRITRPIRIVKEWIRGTCEALLPDEDEPDPEGDSLVVRLARRVVAACGDPVPASLAERRSSRSNSRKGNQDLQRAAEVELQLFLAQGGRLVLPTSEQPLVSVIVLCYEQAPITYSCLFSLAAATALPFEVILVDNGSLDATPALLAAVEGATVIRNTENLGFTRGCNQGATEARGEYLLFLNNDTRVIPGSLDRLVETARLAEDIGAVGGKLIHPDGALQEAGSLVWRDGSTQGYGRGLDPYAPECVFRRDVDYCSGALMLTPRALFEELGGFDEAFSPAYFEEVDYCFRLQATGKRVVYEPEAGVVHLEFGSSDDPEAAVELQRKHREIFRERHAAWLTDRPFPAELSPLHLRSPSARGQRVLHIEDRVPHPGLGQGFPRSHALLLELRAQGAEVTLFPSTSPMESWQEVYADLPREIEVVTGWGYPRLEEFLRERRGFYDRIVVSRPHNMEYLEAVRSSGPELFDGVRVIYDAEALYSSREIELARMLGRTMEAERAREMLGNEASLVRNADAVLSVSELDAEAFRGAGQAEVHAFAHSLPLRLTERPFEDRQDFLFVGSLLEGVTPNTDGLRWFIEEALPDLLEQLPEARLRIVGQVENEWLQELEHEAIEMLGFVDDLAAVYDRSRVFVAPTRFSAGVPLKVLEAASFGLPSVVTDLLERQLGWEDGEDLLVAGRADPAAFAAACVRLYRDGELWSRLRDGAAARIAQSCSPERLRELVDEVVLGSGQG